MEIVLGIGKVFSAEFITKQAKQTGHLKVHNHHNLVAIALKVISEYLPLICIERLHLTVTHLFTILRKEKGRLRIIRVNLPEYSGQ